MSPFLSNVCAVNLNHISVTFKTTSTQLLQQRSSDLRLEFKLNLYRTLFFGVLFGTNEYQELWSDWKRESTKLAKILTINNNELLYELFFHMTP